KDDHIPNSGAGSPATTAIAPVPFIFIGEYYKDDDKNKYGKQGPEWKAPIIVHGSGVLLKFTGQDFKNGIRALVQAGKIIPFLKLGDNNGLDNSAGHGVRQRTFYPISCVDGYPAIVLGQND